MHSLNEGRRNSGSEGPNQGPEKGSGDPTGRGVGNWATTRFTAEDPLPKKIWSRWLKESYAGATKIARRKKA